MLAPGATEIPTMTPSPRRPAACRAPRADAWRTVAAALLACAALGGCANMSVQFANTAPGNARERYFDAYDPGSPVNVWNVL
jgi:hypothetical protein